MGSKAFRLSIFINDKQNILNIVKHKSESQEHFICKIIAYCLNHSSEIEVSQEICRGMLPDLFIPDNSNNFKLWIEIGNFTRRKIGYASHHSQNIILYTYKNIPQVLRLIEQYGIKVYHLNTDYNEIWNQVQSGIRQWKLIKSTKGIYLNDFEITITQC